MEKVLDRMRDYQGLITLIIAILTIAYNTIVTNVNFKRDIKNNKEKIEQLEYDKKELTEKYDNRINKLEEDKVSNITFQMLMKSIDEIKEDLKYLRRKE